MERQSRNIFVVLFSSNDLLSFLSSSSFFHVIEVCIFSQNYLESWVNLAEINGEWKISVVYPKLS